MSFCPKILDFGLDKDFENAVLCFLRFKNYSWKLERGHPRGKCCLFYAVGQVEFGRESSASEPVSRIIGLQPM